MDGLLLAHCNFGTEYVCARLAKRLGVPVLYEACKYIGIKPDLYDPIEEEVKAYLRGE